MRQIAFQPPPEALQCGTKQWEASADVAEVVLVFKEMTSWRQWRRVM